MPGSGPRRLSDSRDAFAHLSIARALCPDDFEVRRLRAMAQARYELRLDAKALEDFNRFVELVTPTTVPFAESILWEDGYIARAKVLNRLGRHDRALEDLEKTLKLPHPIGMDTNLIQAVRAVTLTYLGEHAQAIASAEAIAKSKDLTSDSLFELGRVYALAEKVADDIRVRDQYAEPMPAAFSSAGPE